MKKKTFFTVAVIIGTFSFLGISCMSRNPQTAAQSESKSVVQRPFVPKTVEFVPEEWSENSRIRKLLITDFHLRESAKRVREMFILPDTMDYSLLDLSQYNIVFAPNEDLKQIFPTNSVLSANEETAKGAPIDAAVSDNIFHAEEKHQYEIRRVRNGRLRYYKNPRDVDYSLIGSVNLCSGVESYIVSSIYCQNDMNDISSTTLYLVNCVNGKIISMLKLAEDYGNGLSAWMKQAYRIPAPAGSDIILTKMMFYPLDLEPLDDGDISITYTAYKLNDLGELRRIYKPE